MRGRGCSLHRDDVVDRHGRVHPFEVQLAQGFELRGVLHGRAGAPADEYLAVAGDVAQARGEIGHRPGGAVFDTALEADLAYGGVAGCDAEADTQFVPASPIARTAAPTTNSSTSASLTVTNCSAVSEPRQLVARSVTR